MWKYKAMLRNRAYMLMWSGALISSFGDSLTLFGLAWYVLGRGHNPLEVGLTFLIFDLPGLFSGLLVGWALDRFRREAVMLVDNVLRGGLVLLIPLLDGRDSMCLPVLYGIIALLGMLSVVTQVGTPALITELVPPEEYNTANALEVMQRQISFIAGPGLAGLLVFLIGPLALLWIDSGTFFVFALLLSVLMRSRTPAISTGAKQAGNFLADLLRGIRFAGRSPLLLALLSISFFWNAGIGIFNVALPFYCERFLHVGAAGMGALLSVNSLGVLLSALLFGPLRPRRPGIVACLLLVAQAACYALMGIVPLFWLVLLIYFILGALDDLGAIYLATLRLKAIPGELQGRVLAFTGSVGPAGTPLGNGAAGLLLLSLSAPLVVMLAGLPLCAVGVAWLVAGPLRKVQDTA